MKPMSTYLKQVGAYSNKSALISNRPAPAFFPVAIKQKQSAKVGLRKVFSCEIWEIFKGYF